MRKLVFSRFKRFDAGKNIHFCLVAILCLLMTACSTSKLTVCQDEATAYRFIYDNMPDRGIFLDGQDEDGKTLLHQAAEEGVEAALPLLLANGLDIEARDYSGNTPLRLASLNGNLAVVRYLLDQGASVNVLNKDKYSPLSGAISNDHVAVVQLLLGYGAREHGGVSALHMAARWGAPAVTEMLLARDYNVNATDNKGNTPFSWASRNGRTYIASLLLDNGVSANDQGGALNDAAINGRTDIVRMLLERGAEPSKIEGNTGAAIVYAAQFGHAESIKLLLDHGANIEDVGVTGRTALMTAAKNGYAEVVTLLLDRGADILAKGGRYDVPAVHLAVWKGHYDVVEILLNRGADPNAKNNSGITTLELAKGEGSADIIRILEEHLAKQQ